MSDVLLRALEPSDIDVIYLWENDTDIWTTSSTHVPFSRYMLEQYIISAQGVDIYTSKQLRLMVDYLHCDGGKVPVGCVDIFDYDVFNKRAGVGILMDAKYRNRGLATLAVKRLCHFAKEHLHLHQLYANVSTDNIASFAVFQKNGFEVVGIKKDWLCVNDGFKDEYMIQKIL